MGNTALTITAPNIVHVGLTGKRNSGKSLAASYFKYYFSDWFIYQVHFASRIKEMLAALTGGRLEVIEQEKDEPLLRSILQFIGDKMRDDNPDALIDCVKSDVQFQLVEHENTLQDKIMIIYDGVRRLSEMEFIRDMGGDNDRSFIFLVERTPKDKTEGWMTLQEEIEKHPTETEVDYVGWDAVIDNSQTQLFLRNQIKYIAEFIKDKLKQKGLWTSTTPH